MASSMNGSDCCFLQDTYTNKENEDSKSILEKFVDFPNSFQMKKLEHLSFSFLKKVKTCLTSGLSAGYSTSLETARAYNLLAFILFHLKEPSQALEKLDAALVSEGQEENIVSLANKSIMQWKIGCHSESRRLLEQLQALKLKGGDFRYLVVRAKGELAFSYTRFGPKFFNVAVSEFEEILPDAREPEKSLWKFGMALTLRRASHIQFVPHAVLSASAKEEEVRILALLRDVIDNSNKSLQAKALAEMGMLLNRNQNDEALRQAAGMSAVQACEKALQLDDKDNSVLCKSSRIFRYAKKDLNICCELLLKAKDLRPSSTVFHHLGLTYKAMATERKYSPLKTKGQRTDFSGKVHSNQETNERSERRVSNSEVSYNDETKIESTDFENLEECQTSSMSGTHEELHVLQEQPPVTLTHVAPQSTSGIQKCQNTEPLQHRGISGGPTEQKKTSFTKLKDIETVNDVHKEFSEMSLQRDGSVPVMSLQREGSMPVMSLQREGSMPVMSLQRDGSVPVMSLQREGSMPEANHKRETGSTDQSSICQEFEGISSDSTDFKNLQRQVKSPIQETKFSWDDEHVREVVTYLKRSIEISENVNTRAIYDLALMYKALGELDKALDSLKKLRCMDEFPIGPLDRINAFEQSGLIIEQKIEHEKDQECRDRLIIEMKEMFFMALSLQSRLYSKKAKPSQVQGHLGDVWHSFQALLKAVDTFDTSEKYKLKEKAKLLQLIRKYDESSELLQELASLSPEEPDVLEMCIKNYMELGQTSKAVGMLELLKLVQGKSQDTTSLESLKDKNFSCKVYLEAGRQALLGGVESAALAKSYVKSAFCDAFERNQQVISSSEDSDTTDAEDSDVTWDVMVIHDSKTEAQIKTAHALARFLQNSCGLPTTRLDEDAPTGPEEKGVLTIMKRSKLVVVAAGEEGYSKEFRTYIRQTSRRPSTVLLLVEGNHVPRILKGHRSLSCPPDILEIVLKDSVQCTEGNVDAIFKFLHDLIGICSFSSV